MNAINEIKEILGDSAPAHLGYAKETQDGVVIPVKVTGSEGWNQFYEERNLSRALAPLEDKGWSIEPGPVNFREGTPSVLIIRPPATDGIDTATLPLRDRIRVEGKRKRGKTGRDFIDELEINEETGEIHFDSTGSSGFEQRLIAETVDNLRKAGWTGPVGRRFGKSGIYGTLTVPAQAMKVKQARVNAFLSTAA